MNRNLIATISHNKYKGVMLIKKCLRHLMNRIQSKDHKIGTYEISKIFLSCFDEKYTSKTIALLWNSSSLLELIIKKHLS